MSEKRLAFAALGLAVVIEAVWLVQVTLVEHRHVQIYAPIFTALFALLLVTGGRLRWLAGLLRIAIGLNFGLAVLDRFGVFGGYGSAGVSWGDWNHFVAYARQVNAFLPAGLALALAVAATICEIVLAATLVAGIRPRLFLRASVLLLLAYAVAMTVSLGFASQLEYTVIVLCAGAWALADVDSSFLSVDAVFVRKATPRGRT